MLVNPNRQHRHRSRGRPGEEGRRPNVSPRGAFPCDIAQGRTFRAPWRRASGRSASCHAFRAWMRIIGACAGRRTRPARTAPVAARLLMRPAAARILAREGTVVQPEGSSDARSEKVETLSTARLTRLSAVTI